MPRVETKEAVGSPLTDNNTSPSGEKKKKKRVYDWTDTDLFEFQDIIQLKKNQAETVLKVSGMNISLATLQNA